MAATLGKGSVFLEHDEELIFRFQLRIADGLPAPSGFDRRSEFGVFSDSWGGWR